MQDILQVIDVVRLYPECVNTPDYKGLTPLYLAHKVGSNQIQQLLINSGAKIELAEPGNNNDKVLSNKYNSMWALKNNI